MLSKSHNITISLFHMQQIENRMSLQDQLFQLHCSFCCGFIKLYNNIFFPGDWLSFGFWCMCVWYNGCTFGFVSCSLCLWLSCTDHGGWQVDLCVNQISGVAYCYSRVCLLLLESLGTHGSFLCMFLKGFARVGQNSIKGVCGHELQPQFWKCQFVVSSF